MKEEMTDLKTQARKFYSTKCAGCDGNLQHPSVHFMCMHSYHSHCLIDNERICQKCETEKGTTRASLLWNQGSINEAFYKEMGSVDRFGGMVNYFSKGIIRK